ncbi:glycosyltransferase family 4 protein [Methanocella conradii]|uniref:glycosyltransferase family 4 protein n=1 Tax=Methanocella conradii TaxID=1175444 RepID=UPI00157CD602|nr:glycosyltransferase family 4 protein [Methanocella conradii]
MKILMINYEFPPLGGGGGVACYQLAKELAKKHCVDYLTTGFKGLPKFEVVDGINVYRVPVLGRTDISTATFLSMLSFLPSSLILGIGLCRKNRYDAINAHFVLPSGATGVVLSKIFKVPLVMSIHGGDIYDPSKKSSPHRHFILRKIITLLLNNSNYIIAQSNNTKENAIKFYAPKKDVQVIPLGFIEPVFNSVNRKQLNLSDNDIIIISVGRLIKRKGFDYALRAIAQLRYDNLKYLIIGEGPEKDNLKSLANQLKIQDKVEFLGYQSEEKKFQYLSNANIYLLSSLHEGFGVCLMEAMYCGLPIVSTENGGQIDLLRDRKNALFTPIMDPGALAKKISILIEDSDLSKKMGEQNRQDLKRFYIEHIVKKYEDVLIGRLR